MDGRFFFFSSRRRHTRCYRDWSSDVCSSDLLSVTRRVYAEGLTRPVVVQSTYDRISDVAQFNIYNGPTNYPGPVTTNSDFIIPNGELVVATLNDLLSTSSAREGDHFTLTVRQP